MTALPIQYHLEVYEGSFANDPSFSIEATTPLPSFSVGDYYNHRAHNGWSQLPNTEAEAFRVKAVEHIVWVIEKSHIGYKAMVLLEIAPRNW
jgi:hypothetical protein